MIVFITIINNNKNVNRIHLMMTQLMTKVIHIKITHARNMIIVLIYYQCKMNVQKLLIISITICEVYTVHGFENKST